MSHEQKIAGIDTHFFYDDVDPNRKPLVVNHTSEYLSHKNMRRNAQIIMPFVSEHNMHAIAAVKNNPRFLGAMLWANPNDSSPNASRHDNIDIIRELLRDNNVVGIKMHPVFARAPMNDPMYFPYYRAVQEAGLPVLLHTSTSKKELDSPEMVREISERFPDLKMILAHLGGLHPKWIEPALRLVFQSENVYLNTSSLPVLGRNNQTDINTGVRATNKEIPQYQLADLRQEANSLLGVLLRFAPDKVVAGTDGGYEDPIDCDLSYGIRGAGEETTKMVLLENPYALYGSRLKPFVPNASSHSTRSNSQPLVA